MSKGPGNPVTLVLAVAVTCVVAAAGLGVTYGVTKDRIAEQDRLAQETSLKGALPDANGFEQVTDQAVLDAAQEAAGEVKVGGVFKALDAGGEQMGWGLRLGSRGYGGYVQLVIGLDTSGKVTGVSVLSNNETPGLGTTVLENKDYLAAFAGLPEGFTVKDIKKIDGKAGATKSSNSVKHAVEAAGLIYDDVLSKGGE